MSQSHYQILRKPLWPWLLSLNLLLLTLVLWFGVQQAENYHTAYQSWPTVIAWVDGHPIFVRDLVSAAQLTSARVNEKHLQTTLRRIVDEEIVFREARKLPVNPSEIDSLATTVGHQFADAATLATGLQSAGLTDAALRARLIRHMQIEKWLQQASQSDTLTEAECRAWYAAHPEIADQPEVVEAIHFAAIFPPRGTPEEILEKTNLVRDAQTRLKEGILFPQLINALSDDPAKKITHGSLSWIRRERMETSLIDAAFALPLQEISQLIETRFGFHLLQVNAHQPATTLTYEEVAAEVRQRCADEQRRKKIDSIVTDLRQRAKVEILDPRLLPL